MTTKIFMIEDELHAEPKGVYKSLSDAVAELHRLASLPWDEAPNVAPCQQWRTCGRNYEIVEYDTSSSPWTELSRLECLEITAKGIRWLCDINSLHSLNPS
jgi:hypothetical protein